MKINTILITSLLISISYAGDCISSYNKTGCEKVEFDIGSDMYIQQYKVIYDSDQDGVIDAIDNCQATPLKFKVDEKGCILKEKEEKEIIFETNQDIEKFTLKIYFDEGSTALKEEYDTSIEEFVVLLQEDSNAIAKIVGHSDSTLGNQQNLSLKRAESVKNSLVKLGIDKNRLKLRDAGDSEPIATNSTKVGRSQNRRVEVILEKEGM